jgi:hypothetical protein
MTARARRRRVGGLLLLGLAALLVPSATAAAKNGLELDLHLRGTHGYRIEVGGYDTTAFISASRSVGTPRRLETTSTYIARGKVSTTSVEASFGSLGHVSLRFQPSGPTIRTRPHRHCLGPDHYTIRPGVFVGTVRFRGEDGYATAVTHRVRGKSVTPPELFCFDSIQSILREFGLRAPSKKKRPKVTRLRAGWREAVGATYLEASRKRATATYVVVHQQTEGKLAIYRSAYAKAPASSFGAQSSLSQATFRPPAPFSGVGLFRRDPNGAKVWSGSLAVSFPGEADVPLTGAQFKTQLTRTW